MMSRLLRSRWRCARSGDRRRRQRHAATQTTTLAVVGATGRQRPHSPPLVVQPQPCPSHDNSTALFLNRDEKMRHKKFVEYEELVLRRPAADRPRLLRYRSRAQPPLGITLCYGSFFGEPTPSDAADTNIFVAAAHFQVDPGSVASRDGRIRVGDQILQINGISIHTRQDAIDQFTAPSELVRLLLARTPDEVNEVAKTPVTKVSAHSGHLKESKLSSTDYPNGLVATRCNSAAEKATDSGLSRGTDDSEEHDTQLPTACSPPKSGEDDAMRIVLEEALEADLTQLHREMERIRLECERLYQRQAKSNSIRQQLSAAATPNCQASPPKLRECAFTGATTPTKFCYLHTEAGRTTTSTCRQSTHLPLFVEETSSSAYNTGGDSCRSTPLKHDTVCGPSTATAPSEDVSRPRQLELKRIDTSENIYHTIDTPSTLIGDQKQKLTPPLAPLTIKQFRLPKVRIRDEWPSPTPRMRSKAPENVEISSAAKNERKERKKQKKSIDSNPSRENGEQLVETIAYQQRLLRKMMIDEATILSSVAAASPLPTINAPHPSPPTDAAAAADISRPSCVRTHSNDNAADVKQNVQYEWKVRRRPDGTRYITRRPIRTQVMKTREEEVNRERFALSTDDDAASELKVGRFWSRDERKRHLERAKQRKLRHMKLIHEKAQRAAAGEKEQLQLSRARQQRRNKLSIYDRFTTIQELLAHGAPYAADDTMHGAARVMKVTTV